MGTKKESMFEECSVEDLNDFLTDMTQKIQPHSKDQNLSADLDRVECILCVFSGALDGENSLLREKPTQKWITNLRIATRSILQDPNIDASLKQKVLRISSELLGLYGWFWISSDPQFLHILAELSSMELRIFLDKVPATFEATELRTFISCCSLCEFAWQSVERETVNEELGMKISQSSQNLVSVLLEFLVKTQDENVKIEDIELPIFRLICSFLAQGGGEILQKGLLVKALPILINIGSEERADFYAVNLLLPALEELPKKLDLWRSERKS